MNKNYFFILVYLISNLILAMDKAVLVNYCTKEVFDYTFGKYPKELLKNECKGKYVGNATSKLALDHFKLGVLSSCGSLEGTLRATKTAESKFQTSKTLSVQMVKDLFECKKQKQLFIKDYLGKARPCEHSNFVKELVASGKNCGDMLLEADKETYKTAFNRVCMIKNDEKQCGKLAEEASVLYLKEVTMDSTVRKD